MTKVQEAINYLENLKSRGFEITDEDKNDAANIFSENSFDNYMKIWTELEKY